MVSTRRQALIAGTSLLAVGATWGMDPGPLRLRGRSRLRFLGLAVYDAELWTGEPFDPADYAAVPLKLELTYHRALKGAAIVERSFKEMARTGALPADRLPAWRDYLRQAVPDVQPGQRLAALWLPQRGVTRLQGGSGPGHELQDAEFGPRFLGIWLAPQSSEPELRRGLLGLP